MHTSEMGRLILPPFEDGRSARLTCRHKFQLGLASTVHLPHDCGHCEATMVAVLTPAGRLLQMLEKLKPHPPCASSCAQPTLGAGQPASAQAKGP